MQASEAVDTYGKRSYPPNLLPMIMASGFGMESEECERMLYL